MKKNTAPLLPQGFSKLEHLVSDWAVETTHARLRRRVATSLPELHKFYETLAPQMDAVLTHLTQFPPRPADLPPQEYRLQLLAKSFMEVSVAVELLKAPDEPGVWDHEKMILQEFISVA